MSALEGRRVLVTGATAGIGKAVAVLLTAAGARVAGLGRNLASLHELAAQHEVVPVEADLRDQSAIEPAVSAAVQALGGLDALVNNAGTFRLGRVSDGTPEDWRDMLEVNLLGLLSVTRSAIPHLAAGRNSQIVNISSMSGRRVTGPAGGVYAGTKHAVHAVGEALRAELFERGIRVTTLSPGTVETNYGSYITDEAIRSEAAQDQRDFGLAPEHVAQQVSYILSAPRDVYLVEIALTSARQSFS
jgi:NADP-dependent 3-hydroxy acid dehydrogenase YdfG